MENKYKRLFEFLRIYINKDDIDEDVMFADVCTTIVLATKDLNKAWRFLNLAIAPYESKNNEEDQEYLDLENFAHNKPEPKKYERQK